MLQVLQTRIHKNSVLEDCVLGANCAPGRLRRGGNARAGWLNGAANHNKSDPVDATATQTWHIPVSFEAPAPWPFVRQLQRSRRRVTAGEAKPNQVEFRPSRPP